MKQINVTIPDNKETLFIELLKNLSFVKGIESVDNTEIPEWHKNIIDQRIDDFKEHPENYKDWEELQMELNNKYGV
jgi:hypothetical protein